MPAPVDKGLPRAYRYAIAPELNSGKAAALRLLQQEWQRTLPRTFEWYWQSFLRGGQFPYKPARSGPASTFPATALVTSQKDLMAIAIEGQARSWASNLANRIARSVMRDEMLARDPGLRRELLWINSMRAWLLPYPKQCELLAAQPRKSDMLTAVSATASRLMRRLVRNYLGRFRLPDPMQLPLQVNVHSATLAQAQRTRSFWASRWLRISTLERGRRIEVPVMGNPYADSRGGTMAQTFSLLENQGRWELLATRRIPATPWETHRVEVLGIDLGLRNLMATSEGDLRGCGFLDQLRRYDAQLIKLQQGLQQAGITRLSQCRRYRVLVERLRGWLKTTIQTHLAAVLDLHRPKKVVIEELLFAGQQGELSRRMNRLLRRFGQRYFTQTLTERQAQYGFTLETVDPAYTSQECSACGFVHPGSRKGDAFACLPCGHRAHADVQAAGNQVRRSRLGAHQHPVNRTTRWARALRQWLVQRHQAIVQASPGSSRQYRAVGSARAGLTALLKHKGSAAKLSPWEKDVLQSAAASATLEGLLTGLRLEPGPVQSKRRSVSTRFSG